MATIATTFLLVPSAASAAPGCQEELETFYDESSNYRVPAQMRDALVEMHEAAQALARQNRDGMCADIVSDMRDLLESDGAEVQTAASRAEATTMHERSDEQRAIQREKMARAKPLSHLGAISADQLAGMDVVDRTGDSVGEVASVVLDLETGRVTYLTVRSGGFLGVGSTLHPVPAAAAKIAPTEWTIVGRAETEDSAREQEEWSVSTGDLDNLVLVLPVSQEQMSEAPAITGDGQSLSRIPDEKEKRIASFYGDVSE